MNKTILAIIIGVLGRLLCLSIDLGIILLGWWLFKTGMDVSPWWGWLLIVWGIPCIFGGVIGTVRSIMG